MQQPSLADLIPVYVPLPFGDINAVNRVAVRVVLAEIDGFPVAVAALAGAANFLTSGFIDAASERLELPIGCSPSSRLPELHAVKASATETIRADKTSGLRKRGFEEVGSVRISSLCNEKKFIECVEIVWRVDMDWPSGESVNGNRGLC